MVARQFGATYRDGQATFAIWAPSHEEVRLRLRRHGGLPMVKDDAGWHELTIPCEPGDEYQFAIGDSVIADPASRAQSGRVRGWSVVTDPDAYHFRTAGWRGRPWEEVVIYELHPGLCGGFKGIANGLPELAKIGFTAIELMPIAQFPGGWNWGYDGVLAFAPDRSYGSPDDLKALVDRAHELGVMVFLDVVYNHFGPDGNFLPTSTPEFFREDIQTPWGWSIDFRRPEVRQFYRQNANMWIEEFRLDGLRFDAVHAMEDEGWLVEWARDIRRSNPERQIHLMLENEDNIADFLRNGFDAQWNDDFHHVLHVMLTGETLGYYQDYDEPRAERLARALGQGFVYQGDPSPLRQGRLRGTPSGDLPPTAFVNFLQNHDQIGNRALGERLTVLSESKALEAAVALLLLAPSIPLVFMGEEIGSRAPFHYFVDHRPELVRAIREGRQKEFEALIALIEDLPEPSATETYRQSTPSSDAPEAEYWRDLYRRLLTLRAQHIVPGLRGAKARSAAVVGKSAVRAEWQLSNGNLLTIVANLGGEALQITLPAGEPIWGNATAGSVPGFTTLAWIMA